MKNNTDKEKWIEEVLMSTKNRTGAQPRADLYDQIMRNLGQPGLVKSAAIPIRQWAAAAVILLAINTASVIYYTRHNYSKTPIAESANSIALEIQSAPTYNY